MSFDSARADRLTALVLVAIGLVMVWAGWSMDRLEMRRIHPASIPGLLPMILGGAMVLCAGLLLASARDPDAPTPPGSWRNLAWAGGWSAAFALLMVGNINFYVATAIYVAGFLVIFDTERPVWRRAILGAAFGIAAAAAIGALFRYAFLVRLP